MPTKTGETLMISYHYRSVHEEELKKLGKFRTGAWIHAVAPSQRR